MGVSLDKPQNWKADIAQSVDMYNDWFMKFAPKAFRDTVPGITALGRQWPDRQPANSGRLNLTPNLLQGGLCRPQHSG